MRMKRALRLVAFTLLLTTAPVVASTPADAAPGEVLILGSTVTGGAGSTLAQQFVLAGKTPVVVDDATWSAMTVEQFDAYDAIVLGDPTCLTEPPAVPAANADVWSSVVDGNVVIIGTDETYHETQGGTDLMQRAAAYAVAEPDTTGAYISLSCYHYDDVPGSTVPLLAGLGDFTVQGFSGCHEDAHIVADHPVVDGLTDATLSNWSCSVHEGFDTWPASFSVLAIAEGVGSYTAPDGTVGTPYLLARDAERNEPPDCSGAVASPSALWPPNHRMVTVGVTGVTDPEGDAVTVTITSIRQDEPTNGLGDGDTGPDGMGVGTGTARVRAERAGGGDGRYYHVGFTADDGAGGTCTGTVTVVVPHDRSGRPAGDGGPLHDSTV